MPERMRVLIDTDPGTDDAIALLMALGQMGADRLEVLGVTTVGGNASLAHTNRNTLRILEYAGREEVPVAKGAARPLRGSFPYAYYYHGPGGLSVRLPPVSMQNTPARAAELMRDTLVAAWEPVTIIALGPLTNIARLLLRYPDVKEHLERVVVMGGAVGVPGNVTPGAEFNFYCDPRAADLVLSSGVTVTLVDLRVCREATISRDDLGALLEGGSSARLVGRILRAWFRADPQRDTYDLCDPLAVAVAMQPGIVSTVPGRVRVETEDPSRLGESVMQGCDGPVSVSVGLDRGRFFELFHEALN